MPRILLLEPGYKNKYPPLGLMKISAWHKAKGDEVVFCKGRDSSLLVEGWDRIYITTLFSFEWKRTAEAINFARELVFYHNNKIFVGGIAASLMTEEFEKISTWKGIRFIPGILTKPPAEALRLEKGELHSDDNFSMPIEDHVPDYGILADVDYQYPVHDAYFGYATRGCIRKCHFCGVPKLEGALRDGKPLYDLINGISKQNGEKKDLVLMDNNITASTRYEEIIAEIIDLGFHAGAKIKRNGKHLKRRLDFNQGVDARILCKSPAYLREMAKTCISPLRIAFDHLGLAKPYVQAVRYANEFGIIHLSNYMLYNFHDSPFDLYQRLRTNIELNEELGIRIWSFPMRYQPVTLKDRSHIGPKWTRYQLRSFQVILQATHGVVSGSPTFFDVAFGEDAESFENLLLTPHHMIFNRAYYTKDKGRAEGESFVKILKSLSQEQRRELIEVLSAVRPDKAKITEIGNLTSDNTIKKLCAFYKPLSQENQSGIFQYMKSRKLLSISDAVDPALTEDRKVEDAGLDDDPQMPDMVLEMQSNLSYVRAK